MFGGEVLSENNIESKVSKLIENIIINLGYELYDVIYEKEGKDYYFLTDEEFAAKVLNGDMLEATYFNTWHYGTMKSSLQDGINVGVWNPEGYDCLRETVKFDKDVKLLAYYLQCEDKTRLLRQLNREEHPDVHEIVRRFGTDEEDFEWLDDDDEIKVKWNETFANQQVIFNDIVKDATEAGFD